MVLSFFKTQIMWSKLFQESNTFLKVKHGAKLIVLIIMNLLYQMFIFFDPYPYVIHVEADILLLGVLKFSST